MAFEVSTTIGRRVGGDRAELGDGHLEVRQHLQQQALDLDVGLVGLVDEQHGRLGAPDRGQQRPGEQELLAEDVVVDGVPVRAVGALRRLDAQQLLLVVPLVQRPRLVEALVALQPDQLRRRSPSPAPWPARSCRCRPGPRPAAACRAGRRGRPSSRSARRAGSPASDSRLLDVGDRGELRELRGGGACGSWQGRRTRSADVAGAGDDVGGGGQLRQAQRPAGVQLLGGDADLGAEAELAAVGEPGRGVDQHARRRPPRR